MQAMQLSSPTDIESAPLKCVERNLPVPQPGEVLMKVSCCGACHTDLHIVEGELVPPSLPIIPGHQIIGRVTECGAGVPADFLEKRMGVPWLSQACGHCPACRRDEENLCPDAKFTGFDRDGGYAEFVTVPADFALSLPDKISDWEAAPLMCAGIIGYRSLRCADLQPGEHLGLIGFGASAHLAIQIAHYWGCKVSVFTRSENHRQHARRLGADWVGGMDEETFSPLDRAVIFAPNGELVPLVLEKLRPGGTLAINAVYMSRLPSMPYALLYGERKLRSVANSTRKDGKEFLELVEKAGIKSEVHLYPLVQANQALSDLKYSKLTGEAVLGMGE